MNTMHITASVFINDDESGLHHIMKNEKLPRMNLSVNTTTMTRGEDNAAHI